MRVSRRSGTAAGPLVVVLVVVLLAAGACGPSSADDGPTAGAASSSTPASSTPAPSTPTSPAPSATTDTLDPALAEVARQFVAFARGGAASVPWADRVLLQSGPDTLRSLSPAQASQRSSWRACPPQAADGGFTCPLSPLVAVRRVPDAALDVRADRPDTIGCQRVLDGPARDGARSVSLVPRDATCVDAFLVTLRLDGAGAVSSVDWQLSGP